jgi:carbonic anhydrase
VDKEPMLVLTYERRFVKGNWRKKARDIPVHAFYETYREDVSLFLNLLTFFLPMASADNAFRDYSSVGEILDQADAYAKAIPSENKILEVIHFAESVHETPVFRQYRELSVDKSTGKARGADAFGKEFVELGHRSGYTRNITIRACRRWALMQAGRSNTRDLKGTKPVLLIGTQTKPIQSLRG